MDIRHVAEQEIIKAEAPSPFDSNLAALGGIYDFLIKIRYPFCFFIAFSESVIVSGCERL